MAERRMFAKTIIDSDAFLEMSLSTQALYFHLSMRADDDGFINNPKKIMRMCGANQNDYDVLLAKRFIISFDDGICVIKHWRIHNYIQSDRYKPTVYDEHKNKLFLNDNNSYTLEMPVEVECIQDVSNVDTQVRLGKDSIVKLSIVLVNDDVYEIKDEILKNFKFTYKNIDVEQEILKINAWCLANPTKRKTRRGALRFINSWLNRASEQKKDKQLSTQKKIKEVPEWYDDYQKQLNSGVLDQNERTPEQIEEMKKLVKDITG